MASKTVFCIIEGTSNLIKVPLEKVDDISDLKEQIAERISKTHKDIDSFNLRLRKASVPEGEKAPESYKKGNELFDAHLISNVITEEDFKDPCFRVVIKLPDQGNIKAGLKKISEEFFSNNEEYTRFLTEFVYGTHDLPTIQGPISGLPIVERRGSKARKAPSLLFFNLPSPDDTNPINSAESILANTPGIRHLPLFGVSGCGKTRTALELLSKRWGLYFNAGSGDLGSNDLYHLIQMVTNNPKKYFTNNLLNNTIEIQHLTYGLLYSRLIILNYCLSINSQNTFTCKRWMLLQVATPVFKDIFYNLFQNIFQYLHEQDNLADIMHLVQNLFEEIQDKLKKMYSQPLGNFPIILDEAQLLGRSNRGLFVDSNGITRSLLAPILCAFRSCSNKGEVCVMPCGTGLSLFDLEWSAGSASGSKSSFQERETNRKNAMVVDFPGWTDEGSIRNYIAQIRDNLDNESQANFKLLFPEVLIKRLFQDLCGRFRPIVSVIEDIIDNNEPNNWCKYVDACVNQLTTAEIPETTLDKHLDGNICAELRRVLSCIQSNPELASYHTIEATLKFAIVSFRTHGGFLFYKGSLPKLVESSIGRLRRYEGVEYTVINEPFVFKALDNYFQSKDPKYFQHFKDIMSTAPDEATLGKYWELVVPSNLTDIFHNKVISEKLFNGIIPHNMFHCKSQIVGWKDENQGQAITYESISMKEFLNAHIKCSSEYNGSALQPFFFPNRYKPGPDIVFVIKFIEDTNTKKDNTNTKKDNTNTRKRKGDTNSKEDNTNTKKRKANTNSKEDNTDTKKDNMCPVFVQLKLRKRMDKSDAELARKTVQPKSIDDHNVNILDYCTQDKHYISLIISYPAEVTNHYKNKNKKSILTHNNGVNEIQLTIDKNNIRHLFDKKYVDVLDEIKQVKHEMKAGLKHPRDIDESSDRANKTDRKRNRTS